MTKTLGQVAYEAGCKRLMELDSSREPFAWDDPRFDHEQAAWQAAAEAVADRVAYSFKDSFFRQDKRIAELEAELSDAKGVANGAWEQSRLKDTRIAELEEALRSLCDVDRVPWSEELPIRSPTRCPHCDKEPYFKRYDDSDHYEICALRSARRVLGGE